MGKRADYLITEIRSVTENDLANSAVDISDDEILRFLNDAQIRIQAKIVAQKPNVFLKETLISAVSGQEEYSLPKDCLNNGRILSVEFASDTSQNNYYYLRATTKRPSGVSINGLPSHFIRRDLASDEGGSFLVYPKPISGTFRVTYIRRIDSLDIRRAVVGSATLTSPSITDLTLDIAGDPTIDAAAVTKHDFLCVVDKLGTVKMRNIQYDSINTSTGVVTVTSGFTYEDGETITAGDFIVLGKNKTTHSQLDSLIERYLINYATYKIMKKDSANDLKEYKADLLLSEEEILEAYTDIDEEVPHYGLIGYRDYV